MINPILAEHLNSKSDSDVIRVILHSKVAGDLDNFDTVKNLNSPRGNYFMKVANITKANINSLSEHSTITAFLDEKRNFIQ